jgi:hypothetical protein
MIFLKPFLALLQIRETTFANREGRIHDLRDSTKHLENFPQSVVTRPLHKYVLFDLDMGGSTNIEMGLMVAAVVAKLANRTLVLPPPEPWYMKDYAPNSFLGALDGTDGGETCSNYIKLHVGLF